MSQTVYKALLWALALGFALAFSVLCIPPLIENPDVIGAFAAGFVNPYASGYATDIFFCWAVLAVWVLHEAKHKQVRHGWVALVLGVVPGVATGFAAYLLLRLQQNKS